MTDKKKQKCAIRKRAAESKTSYSTARKAMGITSDTLATDEPDDEHPVEVSPTGLAPNVFNESITLQLRLPDGAWSFTSIFAPLFTVAYAAVGGDEEVPIPLEVGMPRAIVLARKAGGESGWGTLERAQDEYSSLVWRRTSGVEIGTGGAAPSPYWVMWLTLREDGSPLLTPRDRGLRSLEDVLSGVLTPDAAA